MSSLGEKSGARSVIQTLAWRIAVMMAASSILNERGFRPDVIEAALGHQDQNEIRRAYNRASYWRERIELMQAWADCLD